jgi:predicted amidophosphoribosyltransferase
MTEPINFDPVEKAVEFSLGLGIAQQMLASINAANAAMSIPNSFAEYEKKNLIRRCSSCGSHSPYTSTYCGHCGKSLSGVGNPGLGRNCGRCGASTPEDSKFCVACGAPMAAEKCGSCGTENPSAARFCKECGKELGRK